MPAIYHEGSWLGNATDPEVLVKDTVGWTGKNRAYSQTNNAVIAHIENGITYDVSWTGSATVTLKKNSTSGATITSGSTSPLSFTADADYELYFGSSATVTNIMVKDSRITDPTYEPHHESVEEEIEQIYADNGVLGAKNLLPYPYVDYTKTVDSVTFTDNGDGSISLNGTALANPEFRITPDIADNRYKGMILTSQGGSSTASGAYIRLRVGNISSGSFIREVVGSKIVIPEMASTEKYYIAIRVTQGTDTSGMRIYPMLRLASDPDDTYQPHAMTNRELTEKGIGEQHTTTITTGTTGNWSLPHTSPYTISAIRRVEAYAKGYIVIPFVNAEGSWFLKALSIDMQPVASQNIEVTYWTFAA